MFKSIVTLINPFCRFTLLLLITLSVFRFGFSLWQYEHFSALTLIQTLFNGLRIDLSTIGYLLILPALFHPLLANLSLTKKHWLSFLKAYFQLTFAVILFFELATPAFIQEYGLRPNRLFIEYLSYPKEVFSMLVAGHLTTLVLTSVLLVLTLKFIVTPIIAKITRLSRINSSFLSKSVATTLMILIYLLAARGTLGHRPINPAFVYTSTDQLINSLTLNSTYSVAHAIKELGNEKNAALIYGKMPTEKVIDLIRSGTGLAETRFIVDNQPSQSIRKPVYQGDHKNLVIILEESLGAQYVSTLGGLALTPNIDRLYNEGWSFNQLYATGTRSVRGIEAVITGFTPTPARSVVKLDKSQKSFFTLASLLQSNGYQTQFIYGGESHFDNMKSFFLGNGFEEIVDVDDVESPTFIGSWGVSDEDLFVQAHKELSKLNSTNKPFFSFIFTSSNHDPFEYPAVNIPPYNYTESQLSSYSQTELARHKAIQYADHALGNFINQAKKSDYWQNTVFLIVADHDARATSKTLIPIKNFHIPAIILNSDHTTERSNNIVSQIDLPPTLLSLIGVTNESPMLGHDLNKIATNRAMMQYASNFGYLQDNNLTILRPDKPALAFKVEEKTFELTPKAIFPKELELALAHALWGSLAYDNQWYSSKNFERVR
ncbi:LTA synthase family protein [Thalassotalea sediminis]|uniref:LTA synthase family protein n=1 Tax=Thalassotalea sediminis TaxID=1759089 RepID=UPI002574409F|nr:LTA synthase family protein [Thalassotalea sediminis]